MKMIKRLAVVVVSIASLAPVTSVFAFFTIPCGWYAEGNIGTSKQSNKSYDSYGPGITASSSTGLAWNINGGFKFFPFLGLEAGVTSYANTAMNAGGSQFAVDRHWAYDIAAKGIVPAGDTGIEFFAKLGAARLYSSTKFTGSHATAPAGYSNAKYSSTSPYFGLGVNYLVMPTLGLNLQWQRAKGNSNTGTQDLYSIGLTWAVY